MEMNTTVLCSVLGKTINIIAQRVFQSRMFFFDKNLKNDLMFFAQNIFMIHLKQKGKIFISLQECE